jgi:hypothetical protein
LKDVFVKEWPSATDAAKELKIDMRGISNCCNNKAKKYAGFKWKHIIEPDLLGETWMEYKDGFLFSSLSRVRTPTGRIMKQYENGKYLVVQIKRKSLAVAIVVCTLFNGPKPTPKHTVDHIDKNPKNNVSTNLRWATKKEQAENTKNVKVILQISKETGEVLNRFPSGAEASRQLGIKNACISRVVKKLNGHRSTGGFIFRREGEYDEVNRCDVDKDIRTNNIKVILQISKKSGEVINRFPSAVEAGRQLNIFPACITRVCRKVRNSTRGFIFRKEGDYDEENLCDIEKE